jgi:carbonic anhydrase
MAADDHPFAMVLSCADSRVPTELVFGAGAGDLTSWDWARCRIAR